MTAPIVRSRIDHEADVVAVRQQARQLAAALGFDAQDQTRVATAVSEIARNAHQYAGGGLVEFGLEGVSPPQVLVVQVSDRGPGIPNLPEILDRRYVSSTGLGLGLAGARRLVDHLHVDSRPGEGTTVWLRKLLPSRAPAVPEAERERLAARFAPRREGSALGELREQNRELLMVLDDLRARQEDLLRLNRELEDTNRGVVALYAELDERADHLRRADELKSRFLSNMSHEFRTPVNSILALARLLLDRVDGPLNPEQERQVRFIRNAAEDLRALVDDLLDLAKVEAGKTVVRPTEFDVPHLFGALRGMLRPLLVSDAVRLVFVNPEPPLSLYTDESKVSQILRNFVSNALKFTEAGEVRVTAERVPGDRVAFAVADTGIGIAPEDQERIFDEFSQVEHSLQRRVKGTGLGLPLCRRLAQLLGGEVAVRSWPGVGSTFTAVIPRVYQGPSDLAPPAALQIDPRRPVVLVVEDSLEDQLVLVRTLQGSGFEPVPVRTVAQAEQALARLAPRAILLDIFLHGEDAWSFLATLKTSPGTRDIPVLVVTNDQDRGKALALGADAYLQKPIARGAVLDQVRRLTAHQGTRRVLVIDDDDVSRYLVRQALPDEEFTVSEAKTGSEGLEVAARTAPDVILLDLLMPGLNGWEVLDRLQAISATRGIPVIVLTSQVLDEAERRRVLAVSAGILPKSSLSRDAVTTAIHDALALGTETD